MPRSARAKSEYGYYHVIARGNGRQILFEDDEERLRILKLLKEKLTAHDIRLHAWCLMDNHVHLLMDDPHDALSAAMHAIMTAYARYYNDRSGHIGSVFENRFKSIPIRDDAQLLVAARYIHLNPERAGICSYDLYPWSSAAEYLDGTSGITDTEVLRELLSGTAGAAAFHHDPTAGPYVPVAGRRVDDTDVLEAARMATHPLDPHQLKGLAKPVRNQALQKLRDCHLTIKQIERVTGIGRGTIVRNTVGARQKRKRRQGHAADRPHR